MTRGLVSAQINILDDNAVIVETLIQIVYNGASVFLTTGQTPTVATTSTSGGSQTYSVGTFGNISDIRDTDFTSEHRVAIEFTGDPAVAMSPHSVIPLNYPNYETRFIIHKLFRNVSNNAVASAAAIQVFDGVLVKRTYVVGATERLLTFDVFQKSKFANTYSPFLNNNGLGVI